MTVFNAMISLPSKSLLLLTLFTAALRITVASDATSSRLDELERRIASLENLTKSQSEKIEGLLGRGLLSIDDSCFPKRVAENVCLFENDVAIKGKTMLGSLKATSGDFTGQLTAQNIKSKKYLEVGGTFKPPITTEFQNIVVSGKADFVSLKTSGPIFLQGPVLAETLEVNENVNIKGNLNVDGSVGDMAFHDLTVLGTASISDLSASTASITNTATVNTLTVGTDAGVAGNLKVGGTFVPAKSTFQDITVSGTATVGTLSAASASIANTAAIDTLIVGADAGVAGNLKVGGKFAPAETTFQDITVSGTANVGTLSAFSASIANTATIDNLSVGSNAGVKGSLKVGGTFAPAETTFQDIMVSGKATVGTLSATTASVSDLASVQTLTVVSDADVAGSLSVGGTLAPAKSTFQDVTVSGTATVGTLLATSISASEKTALTSLSVRTNAFVRGDLTIQGIFDTDVLQCQDITVIGTAAVGSLMAKNAVVDKIASIKTLDVGANAVVLGDLEVGGDISSITE